MATTENSYTGNGTKTKYSFTFPYIKADDVKVSVDGEIRSKGTDTDDYTQATTSINFNTAPADNAKIRVYRVTDDSSLAATFYPGSAIRSTDLNDNFTQNLYATQEVVARYLDSDGISTMSAHLKLEEDVDIIFEGGETDDHQTTLTVEEPTGDNTVTIPNRTGTIITTGDTGSVTSTMIANATIVNDDISANAAIAGSKLLAATTSAAGSMSAADKEKLDGIADNATADQTATEIRAAVEAATDSNVFTDADHTKLNAIEDNATADQTANEIKILVGSAEDSNVFTDDDHDKLDGIAAGATVDQTASDIKTLLASDQLGETHIANSAITTDKIAEGNVGSNALATNAVTIGKLGCETTTISGTNDTIPTSQAVINYVSNQLNALPGGFQVIDDEDKFPTSQPDEGVMVSIANAEGLIIQDGTNGTTAGRSTTARTDGNGTDNVTINGFPTSLQGETLAANVGLMVVSTGADNTYTYHKILAAEGDVKQLSDDINDFNSRYRVHAGDPSSDNDEGDLCYNTSANTIKVYDSNISQWKEIVSAGDYKYLFLCPENSSGAPTFNESIDTYDLREGSNTGTPAVVTNAAQLIVSVNDVIQKPNTGTGTPSEGFSLYDGNTIIFATAPPENADIFITQIGTSTTINIPADLSVTEGKINSYAVTTNKIADDAVTSDKLANNIDIGGTLDVTGAATLTSKVTTGGFESGVEDKNGFEFRTTGEMLINSGRGSDPTFTIQDNGDNAAAFITGEGAATFTGNVVSNKLFRSDRFTTKAGISLELDSTDYAFAAYQDSTSPLATIGVDGAATFEGTINAAPSSVAGNAIIVGDDKIIMEANGDATFSGEVKSSKSSANAADILFQGKSDVGQTQNTLVEKFKVTAEGTIVSGDDPNTDSDNIGYRVSPSTGIIARSSGTNQLWTGYKYTEDGHSSNDDVTSEIDAAGDALFAGQIKSENGTGDVYLNASENALMAYNSETQGATTTVEITKSGDTKFAGQNHDYNNSNGLSVDVYVPSGDYKSYVLKAADFTIQTGTSTSEESFKIDSSKKAWFSGDLDVSGSSTLDGAVTIDNDVTFKGTVPEGSTANFDAIWDKSDNSLKLNKEVKLKFEDGFAEISSQVLAGSLSKLQTDVNGAIVTKSWGYESHNTDHERMDLALSGPNGVFQIFYTDEDDSDNDVAYITTHKDNGITVGSVVRPETTNTYDLGTSSLVWNNLYVKDITSSGDISTTSGKISGAVYDLDSLTELT